MATNSGNRRSIRIPGYDYSSPGTYVVTICAEHRACIFGTVLDGVMALNDVGQMVDEYWAVLPAKFPDLEIDSYAILPNHFHGILRLGWNLDPEVELGDESSRPSLSRIMQWFKSITTAAYGKQVRDGNWPPYPGRMWQRNYYEHIVRSEPDLDKLRAYIEGNASKWSEDPIHNPQCRGFR